jgi:hypothetical protein
VEGQECGERTFRSDLREYGTDEEEVTGMPVEIIDASGKLLQLKVRGMLRKTDHERLLQIAREAIEREGNIRALIVAKASRAGSGTRAGET